MTSMALTTQGQGIGRADGLSHPSPVVDTWMTAFCGWGMATALGKVQIRKIPRFGGVACSAQTSRPKAHCVGPRAEGARTKGGKAQENLRGDSSAPQAAHMALFAITEGLELFVYVALTGPGCPGFPENHMPLAPCNP